MTGNSVTLCALFSAGIGLCFAISGAIPAWFAAKDREVEEYNKSNKKEKSPSRIKVLPKRQEEVLKEKTSPW